MAKYDSHSSRSTAIEQIEQDDAPGDFYRPAASRSARAPREIDPASNPARVWSEASNDSAEESEEDAFLRARRRVPVRRGPLPKSRAGRILFMVAILLGLAALAMLAILTRNFFRNDPRFRIDSSSNIQILGNSQVTRQQLLSIFGSDIGRNIFFVPLAERRAELEQLPWVAHATVMRLLPNQLRVAVAERRPIAFLRAGSAVRLVDGDGVLLNLPPAAMAASHYSFPVVTGISARDPLPLRAARMLLYRQFIAALDAGGEKISAQLSEVDLSDPEDIRAVLPANGAGIPVSIPVSILVHFGEGDFLNRYRRYRQHLADWMRQYPHLASVDLRFDNQVVLEMDHGPDQRTNQRTNKGTMVQGTAETAGSGEAAAHPAVAGRKPAAGAAKRVRRAKAKSPGADRDRRRGPARSQP